MKHINYMLSLCQTSSESVIINFHKLNHEITRSRFLILYIFNLDLQHNQLSFTHSNGDKRKYNFNNIAETYRSFIAQFFVILLKFSKNENF